jgi:hypothetical protein
VFDTVGRSGGGWKRNSPRALGSLDRKRRPFPIIHAPRQSQNLTHWSVWAGPESLSVPAQCQFNSTGRKTALAMMLLGNCTSIDFLGHKAPSSRVYDVKLLAGQTHHAFISALATGRLLVPFGIALNVLSRCGTAKDDWFRHGPPSGLLPLGHSCRKKCPPPYRKRQSACPTLLLPRAGR